MRLSYLHTCSESRPAWPSWVAATTRRRADPFTRLACAAVDGVRGNGWQPQADSSCVVSTAFGAVESTYRFGMSIHDHGDASASPTPFTHSVHNSCAGAIGESLHLHGPSTTISQGEHSIITACRWAHVYLSAGRAPDVLLIVGDCHNDWSRSIVCTWGHYLAQDGVCAGVLHTDLTLPGRDIHWTAPIDSAPISDISASAQPHDHWNGAALAAIPPALWQSSDVLHLLETEDDLTHQLWLGPWQST